MAAQSGNGQNRRRTVATGAGNTLRPTTELKLVFRLPPTLCADQAATTVRERLERDPPYGSDVKSSVETPQTGWYAPSFAPWPDQALQSASLNYFEKPKLSMGMGGTIPFLRMPGEAFSSKLSHRSFPIEAFPSTQLVVTGVLGPASNAHGPNEFLHLPTARRRAACVAHVISVLNAEDDYSR